MSDYVNRTWDTLYRNESDGDLQHHIDRLRSSLAQETSSTWRGLIERFLESALHEQEDRVNRQLLEWSTKGGCEGSQQSVVG